MAKLRSIVKSVIFSLPILLTYLLVKLIISPPFIVGIVIASCINWFWWHAGYAGSKYDKNLEEFEHYHHSLWMISLAMILHLKYQNLASFLYGFSLVFWLDECFYQNHPFATGSNHERSSNFIGFLLLLAWIITYFRVF